MRSPLLVGGILVVVMAWQMRALSAAFVFGIGQVQRPIPLVLLWYGIGCAAAWWAFWAVTRRRLPATGSGAGLAWIVAVALVARFFLWGSHPIQETDPYRYLWDGHAVLQGVNPYLAPPAEVAPAQASLRTDAAREIHRQINHPGIRTVYPPAAQGLFAAAQWLTPWSLGGWRVLVLAADLANLALLLTLLAGARLPLEWALLYGWSPLILKEFGNSLHLDVFVVLGLLLMMIALQRGRVRMACVALALAGLVKLAPLILLPPVVGWAWRRAPRQAVVGMGLALATLIVGYLPFLSAGWRLFDGLGHFASRWRVNDSLFSLLAAVVSDGTARVAVGALLTAGAGMTVLWVMRGVPGDPRRLWAGLLGLLTAAFLLLPTGNPWYFSWVLPFLTVVPVRTLVWLSGALGLYYLDFWYAYHGAPQAFRWVRVVEYGSTAMVGGWEWWRWRQRSLS
ncbi:MAG: hypothetical protein HY600_06290 [Candidatus Omnitrophica bacterium]|nr:hypothetical protein [Candidatus Omnitrophota bacterium]